MSLILIAFFSGVLTVLAPCILPILPLILGASVEGSHKKIPVLVIASLSVSTILFSLLLKTSTLLIDVPPSFWTSFSGGIIITLGVITLFPNLWENMSIKLGFSGGSHKLLQKSTQKKGALKYIFIGFALGPVFTSCSPTYAVILAIILPAHFVFGLFALISYTLGLAVILFAIAIFGQVLVKKLRWVSNPHGIFHKILGILFIGVGLAIVSGYDKKIQSAVLDTGFFNTTKFEQSIIDTLKLETLLETSKEEKQVQGKQCQGGSCEKIIEGSLDFLHPDNILEKGKLTHKGYPAPDFIGLTNWIHSEGFDSIKELRGQVVMIDFWTLGCINCINTHTETNLLYDEFKSQGLEIIGIHAPEFQYEQKKEEVQKAVERFHIRFPVVQDNDFQTWKRYNNKYWPAFYIIDRAGYVRYTHFGEGGYEKKREVIRALLKEEKMLELHR